MRRFFKNRVSERFFCQLSISHLHGPCVTAILGYMVIVYGYNSSWLLVYGYSLLQIHGYSLCLSEITKLEKTEGRFKNMLNTT